MTVLSQILNGSTGLDVRDTLNKLLKDTRPTINVKAYFGAKGDGVTDDTVAIQNAINFAALQGGALLYFDDGRYIIGGALQDTSYSNAQLLLPVVNNNENSITIGFVGPTPPITTWTTNTGAILQSTLTTGNGQMIGVKNSRAPTGNVRDPASWVFFYAQNMTFRMPQNSTNSCLDLSYVPMYKLLNVRVDVVGGATHTGAEPSFNMAEPTTATSYGIKGPINDLPIWCQHDNVMVMGYYTGSLMGELASANDLTFLACKWAMEFPEAHHPSYLGRVLVCNCPNTLRYTGTSLGTEIVIEMLDIEHGLASGSGPSWVESARITDISDPNNYMTGSIRFRMRYSPVPFLVTGAANLTIQEAAYPHLGTYPLPNVFPTFASTDPGVVTVRRKKAANSDVNQSPWLLLASNQASTNGYLGFISWVNEAVADGNDKRGAQIYAQRAGAGNRTDLYFSTGGAAAGTVDQWAISSAGNLASLRKGNHITQVGGANGDIAGTLTLSAATSATFTFTAAYGSAPAVIVTPQFDVGAGVRWWVTATASGFTINTSASVTGSFAYHAIGNPT